MTGPGAIAPSAGSGEEMRQLPKKHSFGGVGMISPHGCDKISTGFRRTPNHPSARAEGALRPVLPFPDAGESQAVPKPGTRSVVQEESAAAAPVPDRALRRIPARNPCGFDALVDLAEAAVPDITVIGVGAGAENRRPSRKDDLLSLAAAHGRRERALLGLNAGGSGHEGKNKSCHSHVSPVS
jgi:hypothetical protein